MTLKPEFRQQCERIIEDLQLGPISSIVAVSPLPGGVSSDIAMVELDGRKVCIKCALPQLKVAATWTAPVSRNLAEYQWLKFAASILPNAVPELLGHSEKGSGFAMAYLDSADAYNYKQALLDGQPDDGVAGQIGRSLALIHARSTRPEFNRKQFDYASNFYSLRLEPYLIHTVQAHPEIADELNTLSTQINNARIALIHGDVSPKNLLITRQGPVFLDAECATFGDPAFDVSFFLNHLMLKAVHMPVQRAMLLAASRQFWANYQAGIDWENPGTLALRVCRLLPALMLARIDGKSPVEYLKKSDRKRIRTNTVSIIRSNPTQLDDVLIALTSTETD